MEIIKVLSPGRVNLIGEHTDHQKGFVLPVCINLGVIILASERKDTIFKVFTEKYHEIDVFDCENIQKDKGWRNYIRGIVKSFKNVHPQLKGANVWISSTLPASSGLSSSASLELGIFTTLEALVKTTYSDEQAINICWNVENEFVRVKCGIMIQFIIRKGIKNYALLINCNNLESNLVEIPSNISIIVVDTLSPRDLTTSPYNQRIKECEMVLEQFKSLGLQIENLSELTELNFKYYSRQISEIYAKRAEHIITENIRVKKFKEALELKNTHLMGQLLYESHVSLKNNFEASWSRADILIEKCKHIAGIIGARMTGAGWGGSVLILVDAEKSQAITDILQTWSRENFTTEFVFYQIMTSDKVSSANCSLSTLTTEVREFLSSNTIS